jgi:hypothetical protein
MRVLTQSEKALVEQSQARNLIEVQSRQLQSIRADLESGRATLAPVAESASLVERLEESLLPKHYEAKPGQSFHWSTVLAVMFLLGAILSLLSGVGDSRSSFHGCMLLAFLCIYLPYPRNHRDGQSSPD